MATYRPVYETALSHIDLHALSDTSKAVYVREVRNKACITLRVLPDDTKSIAIVRRCGVTIPTQLHSTGTANKALTLWLAPDHYLLIIPRTHKEQWLQTLDKALTRRFTAVVDVSGSYTQLTLGGKQLLPVMSKLVNYDLRHNFPRGKVVSTLAGSAPVILRRTNAHTILLLVRFSYSAYLAEALLQAAQEYISP